MDGTTGTAVSSATDLVPPAELPDETSCGIWADWTLPTGDSRDVVRFRGRFLGMSSSRRSEHAGHRSDRPRPPNQRCGACRWFEPRIFAIDPADSRGAYLVHFAGRSTVPGEIALSRHEFVRSAHEVVEVLTTRRVTAPVPRLTQPAARALAQAASHDDEIEFAFVNRATA